MRRMISDNSLFGPIDYHKCLFLCNLDINRRQQAIFVPGDRLRNTGKSQVIYFQVFTSPQRKLNSKGDLPFNDEHETLVNMWHGPCVYTVDIETRTSANGRDAKVVEETV